MEVTSEMKIHHYFHGLKPNLLPYMIKLLILDSNWYKAYSITVNSLKC